MTQLVSESGRTLAAVRGVVWFGVRPQWDFARALAQTTGLDAEAICEASERMFKRRVALSEAA